MSNERGMGGNIDVLDSGGAFPAVLTGGNMGAGYADRWSVEITLKNAADVANALEGRIPEDRVREATVRARVDAGAGALVVGGELCRRLGLDIEGIRGITLAGGERAAARISSPVEIYWEGRLIASSAMVLTEEGGVLPGAIIPLEGVDKEQAAESGEQGAREMKNVRGEGV